MEMHIHSKETIPPFILPCNMSITSAKKIATVHVFYHACLRFNRLNFSLHLGMSKVILSHFYNLLTSQTYTVCEESYHTYGYTPDICLTQLNLTNVRRDKLQRVKQQTNQILIDCLV
jgi:hypothetical protein